MRARSAGSATAGPAAGTGRGRAAASWSSPPGTWPSARSAIGTSSGRCCTRGTWRACSATTCRPRRMRLQRAFWFEATGTALLLFGTQTAMLDRQGVPTPRSTGWALAALAVAGGAALPASGFWTLLVPATLIAYRVPAGRHRMRGQRARGSSFTATC